MDEILAQLQQYVAATYLRMAPAELPPDQLLISSGLIDSFNLVDLALWIEGQFGVHLDDTELNAESFNTLEQLTSLIRYRR